MKFPYSEIGCTAKGFFAVCSIIILTLSACSPVPLEAELPSVSSTSLPATATGVPSLSSTEIFPPEPTTHLSVTPAPEKETLSATQIPLTVIQPLVTRNGLRFDSWSPDSEWLAYWFEENNEALPASLGFANAHTGEVCSHEEVVAPNLESGYVIWQKDGSVIIISGLDAGAFAGIPCKAFAQLESYTLPDQKGELSPNGRYRAVTTYTPEGQLIHYTVMITDTMASQSIGTFSWDASVHAVKSGPTWLNNDLYLIGQTFQQGVLYLSLPHGQTGNVLTDLLGIETYDEETVWWVFSQADPATGEYHLLLQWWGGPTEWPPLLLYHGELGLVEELPFYRARPFSMYGSYGFSPDGQWLLVGNPVETGDPARDPGQDYWLRPVDPPGGSFTQVANQAGLGGLSSKGQRIAFFHSSSYIHIVSFPEGQLLSQWHTPGYDVDRLWWAPNDTRLVVWGLNLESGQNALFVIEP